ncbi:MAG: DUF294 nucleotidyltransferase-like domain-containing protein [Pseudomonadota bacterium]|nr:DUF294 nucleotidyltransferase-like domain-containing protein [Pseudomonadota bacterium]
MQLATMPLDRVPVASLDLETTGLRARTDRIVQIGAIRSDDAVPPFAALVRLGVPIPVTSTRIHRIDDEMVAGADEFPMVLPRLRTQIGGHLILGYNIGFDLAVLEAEAERHGVEWSWSAALCLRQLATCLLGTETMMMLGDLEALATHCQVPVVDRHTALGDAAITLAVYRHLLPALAEAGIVTLGDAWREVARLDSLRQANVAAGWVDVAAAHAAPQDHAPLARIDPYPYQHRIRELTLEAALIMSADATLAEAAAAMNERSADCVFVGGSADSVAGIVSERDIVRQVRIPVTDSTRVREMPLHSIMSSPVITVGADDFMHVALGRMSRFDIRHLAVVDPAGIRIGWVSSRELVRQRVTAALVIGDRLATAETTGELAAGLRMLPTLAASLSGENVPGQDIAAVISGQYRAALSEATRLAEGKMIEADRGAAPVEFAMLMLGSAARGESLLAADQDHAILFADGGDGPANKAWFMALGGHVADILDASGIPYCTGGVMSRHDEWCRSLAEWRRAIGGWVRRGNPRDLLNVDIFFDFEPVHGSAALAGQLQTALAGRATRRGDFLKLLARNVAGHGGGRTLLGGLRTENGRFNMKRHLSLPLVETLRVLAISRGITARSSAARAAALAAREDISPEVGRLGEDVAVVLRLVLRQQIADIAAGRQPGNGVDLKRLSATETGLVKSIAGHVGRLDTLLKDTLFG